MAKRRKPAMPPELRKEAVEHCRSISRKYGADFAADRDLKDRLLRLERALLPPRPRRRGRPKNPIVTRAIALYRKLRRESPQQSPRQLWSQVYPRVIERWDTMSELDRRGARDQLRERIAWRRRKRLKIPTQLTV
jgi:hypothetical protein